VCWFVLHALMGMVEYPASRCAVPHIVEAALPTCLVGNTSMILGLAGRLCGGVYRTLKSARPIQWLTRRALVQWAWLRLFQEYGDGVDARGVEQVSALSDRVWINQDYRSAGLHVETWPRR